MSGRKKTLKRMALLSDISLHLDFWCSRLTNSNINSSKDAVEFPIDEVEYDESGSVKTPHSHRCLFFQTGVGVPNLLFFSDSETGVLHKYPANFISHLIVAAPKILLDDENEIIFYKDYSNRYKVITYDSLS